MTDQGDLALLDDPVAQELLVSTIPARLAYTWTDGTARVVPIWFNWSGGEVVMGSPAGAPKLKALTTNPSVAVTIDTNGWPAHVLMLRGNARVEMKDDVDEDYALACERYMGQEAGREWVAGLRGRPMGRIAVKPEWVGILDFETRLPSALSM
jgi:pyridoxamine 5'-phosphate oxidase-like protein